VNATASVRAWAGSSMWMLASLRLMTAIAPPAWLKILAAH
jgi:hypothetical protein